MAKLNVCVCIQCASRYLLTRQSRHNRQPIKKGRGTPIKQAKKARGPEQRRTDTHEQEDAHDKWQRKYASVEKRSRDEFNMPKRAAGKHNKVQENRSRRPRGRLAKGGNIDGVERPEGES